MAGPVLRPRARTGRSRTIAVQLSPPSARAVDLAAGRAEVHAARVERVDAHRVAEHVDVAILLRQAAREWFPVVAAGAAAVDAELALGRNPQVGVHRHGIDRVGFVRVNVDREAEIGRQVSIHLDPLVARIVAAEDAAP